MLQQAQYFANSPLSLYFEAITPNGSKNKIHIHQFGTKAEIKFREGPNPLGSIPTNFKAYSVRYESPAEPTDENIDAILQWKQAERLYIQDNGTTIFELFQRIDELGELTKLYELGVYINANTYDKVDVATLINVLPSLRTLSVHKQNMNVIQFEEFKTKNVIPSNWYMDTVGVLSYRKNI